MGANTVGLIATSQHPRDLIQHMLDPCAIHGQRAFSDRSRTQHSTNFCKSFSLIIYQLCWVCYYFVGCRVNFRSLWRLTPTFETPMLVQWEDLLSGKYCKQIIVTLAVNV